MTRKMVTIDGNEAAAYVAFRTNEVIAIYPITPSSPMGEWSDAWAAEGLRNIWGTIPSVTEMQSEGGAAGAVHGALQTGALTTTFTASQGLLLMIPNMFKIAGELTPTVFHVSARTVATHALSIFGDHSDVLATRTTGFGLIASNSIQEIMDFALIAQAATLESRVPFVHFFDGFRSSHEVMKIEQLTDDDMRAMIDDELVFAHRSRRLTPESPVLRGSAQNPDVFFQAREACNPYYAATAGIVQKAMDKFAGIVGRQYHLFDYFGAPDAERVIVLMGSGAEAAQEAVEYLTARGEKIGMVKVRLYRPFDVSSFMAALPPTVRVIATLDRTKEPGGAGEPLYQDVVTAVGETFSPRHRSFQVLPADRRRPLRPVVEGIHPGHGARRVRGNEKGRSRRITSRSASSTTSPTPPSTTIPPSPPKGTMSCAPCSTASAPTAPWAPTRTRSRSSARTRRTTPRATSSTTRRRPAPSPCRTCASGRARSIPPISSTRPTSSPATSSYFLERQDMLKDAMPGATFLLNSPFGPDEVWDKLPRTVQQQIIDKNIRFYVIDGYKVAKDTGMGARVNTIMQTCFFAISGVLPRDEAIESIKDSIKKTYGAKGEEVVRKNFLAVEQTLANLFEVKVPEAGYQLVRPAARGGAGSAGLRAERGRADHGRPRRFAAGERSSRWTAHSRPGPASGRSATSPSKSRPGIRRSASSAASAPSSARMLPSASRPMT